jgi:electron transport complex protein RnfA
VIAVVVQFTEMVIRKSSPTLYRLLGIFPCRSSPPTVLGVALLSINERHNFIQASSTAWAAFGFSLVLILFAAMRGGWWPPTCRHRFAASPSPWSPLA